MFKNIQAFLNSAGDITLEVDQKGNPSSNELQIATVAVLISAARSSEGFDSEELMRLTSSLFGEFGTNDEQSGDLLAIAELLLKKPGRLETLIAATKKGFAAEQREKILSLAWRVLLADQRLDAHEAKYAAELRNMLGLSLEQAMRAQALASQHVAFTPLQDSSLSTDEEE